MNDDIPRSEKTEVPDSLSGTGTDVRTEPAGSGLPADPEMPPENGPAYMDEDTLMMPDEDYNMYDPAVGMKLDEVLAQTRRLQREFQSKIKYDAHKNKIIDDLHQELQVYKNDIIQKHLSNVMMDIIQFMDNTRKLARYYRELDPSERDPEKLLSILEEVPSDLEALTGRQGLVPFTCEGDQFDPARQRVLTRVTTSDKSRDKTVAESLQPGYEWDNRLIRPEIVSVYVYKPAHEAPETGSRE